jgi:hypothetical protein
MATKSDACADERRWCVMINKTDGRMVPFDSNVSRDIAEGVARHFRGLGAVVEVVDTSTHPFARLGALIAEAVELAGGDGAAELELFNARFPRQAEK